LLTSALYGEYQLNDAFSGARRVDYLDGLRGVAALVVLLGHSLLVFVEPIITLNPSFTGRLAGLAVAIGKSPFGFLWNGNSAVCIFFVLSGFVMADFARQTSLSFPAQIVRRYIRLALPILLSSSFAYLLLGFGLLRNTEAAQISGGWLGLWYQFAPSWRTMAYEALAGTFLNGSNAYNPNLWTMHPELLGSFYILAIGLFRRWGVLRLALYLVMSLYYWNDYLPLFAIGALLRDVGQVQPLSARPSLSVATFLIGCYICSLPAAGPGVSLPWHWPLPVIFGADSVRYWHSAGAVLIVFALLHSPVLQRPFQSGYAQFLGRISFTLYLMHIPLLCSLGAWLIIHLSSVGYLGTALIGMPISVMACLLLSAIATPAVDGLGIRSSRFVGAKLDGVIGLLMPVRVATAGEGS